MDKRKKINESQKNPTLLINNIHYTSVRRTTLLGAEELGHPCFHCEATMQTNEKQHK